MKKPKALSIKVDQYCIDIDYDVERDCETHGCDFICRCSTINNIKIISLNDPITVANYPASPMNDYCIGRLLSIHGCYKIDNYEVNTCAGYYGEEIRDVSFNHMRELLNDVTTMLALGNDLEKLKYVLLKEYSFLPDYFDSVTGVAIQSVNLSDIVLNCIQKRVTVKMTVDPSAPVGLLRRVDSTKYTIVDGYSRFSILRGANMVSAPYFVLL